ncbi:MAG TPA: hypothetical protein DDX75_14360 [Phycisphaerales bacterium]|nr:hypothetical protein [Phycisphaerales bacterium]
MFNQKAKTLKIYIIFSCISLISEVLANPINLPPVINSVTASPNSISYTKTSQLLADVNDPDKGPLPLRYKWIVPAGTGSLSSYEISNPVYTPPEVNYTQTFNLKVEVSDGNDTADGSVNINVIANTPPVVSLISASPDSIFDTQTSQLLVSAFDEDNGPLPLSYQWIVPAGSGSINNPAITNPIYTPPDVTGTQTFSLVVNVSDGREIIGQTIDITVSGNIAPVINSAAANPDTILDTQTSQLLVSAIDSDNGPSSLSYSWIVPPGGGTVSNPTIAAPTYLPPDVSGTQTYNLKVNISDGDYTVTGSIDVVVNDSFVLFASFDANSNNFVYVNNPFKSTTASGYASGERRTNVGYSGSALEVSLGGTDTTTVVNMSGGWQSNFYLPSPGNVTFSFRYNLTQSPNYENNEYSDLMGAIDGILFRSGVNQAAATQYGIRVGANDYIDRIYGDGDGGPQVTTGWKLFTDTLNLNAGMHTITIGGFNNQKTDDTEFTSILIDNISILKY